MLSGFFDTNTLETRLNSPDFPTTMVIHSALSISHSSRAADKLGPGSIIVFNALWEGRKGVRILKKF